MRRCLLTAPLLLFVAYYAGWNGERWIATFCGTALATLLTGIAALLTARSRLHTWGRGTAWLAGLVATGLAWQAAVDLTMHPGAMAWWRPLERLTGLAACLTVAATPVVRLRGALRTWMCATATTVLVLAATTLPDPSGQAIHWFGFGNINQMVHILMPGLLAGSAWVIWGGDGDDARHPRRERLALAAIVLIACAVFAWIAWSTGRRAVAAGALVAAGAILLDAAYRRHPRATLAAGCVTLAIVIVAAATILPGLDPSGRGGRILQYAGALAWGWEQPLTGHGSYGIFGLAQCQAETARHLMSTGYYPMTTHNELVDAWLDGGVPALAIACTCILTVLWHAHRVADAALRRPLLALVYGCLPGLMLDNAFSRLEGIVCLGVIAGLAMAGGGAAGPSSGPRSIRALRWSTGLAGLAALGTSALLLPMATMAGEAYLSVNLRVLRSTYAPEAAILLHSRVVTSPELGGRADVIWRETAWFGERFRWVGHTAIIAAECAIRNESGMTDLQRLAWVQEPVRLLPMRDDTRRRIESFREGWPHLFERLPPAIRLEQDAWTGRAVGGPDIDRFDRLDDAVLAWCRLSGRLRLGHALEAGDWASMRRILVRWPAIPGCAELAFRMILQDPSGAERHAPDLGLLAIRSFYPKDLIDGIDRPDQARAIMQALAQAHPDTVERCEQGTGLARTRDEDLLIYQLQVVRMWGLSRRAMAGTGTIP